MVDELTGKVFQKELNVDGEPMGKIRDLNAIGLLGMLCMWYLARDSCARNLALLLG